MISLNGLLNDLALEDVESDTRMMGDLAKIVHALAAICQPRTSKWEAA